MRPAIWLGMAALGLYGLWAFSGTVADIQHFRAQSWAEAWAYQAEQAQRQGQGFRPIEADWQAAYTAGHWATRLSPLSPDYAETLALIHEYRNFDLPGAAPAARASRLEALRLYRWAAGQRPTWPYVQASIARVKVRLGEWDAELETALGLAAKLGPWEPEVMRVVVDAGLTAWPELSPATRQLVINTVLRSQSWQNGPRKAAAQQVWAVVTAHRKQAALCAWMPRRGELYAEFCNPEHWQPAGITAAAP